MCGFAGIVDLMRPVDREAVRAMAVLLRHRGPDDEGYYDTDGASLAGLRLAIIGADSRGRQPFESSDGRHALCFNGAIYNYRELRDELRSRGRSFRSESDTEVLLEAYREWGPASLDRLNGMFAFAVWDRSERRLFCARDRFGIKPFYFTHERGRLAFASEIKALLRVGPAPAENRARVADFLAHGLRDHTNETLFAGVVQLRPSEWLSLDAAGLRIGRWWQPPLDAPEQPRAPEEVLALLQDAVRLRLRSDVPVGSCLSGGIDSATVVGLASRLLETGGDAAALGPRQRTFTVGFPGESFDEEPLAKLAAEAARAEQHVCRPAAGRLLELLPRITWHHDEPLPGASVVAQWHVMQLARESGVTVLLDGQGGDEVFAGYEGAVGFRLADLAASGRVAGAIREGGAFLGGRDRTAAWLVAATARAFLSVDRRTSLRARLERTPGWLAPDLPHRRLEPAPTGRDRLRRRLGETIRDELPSLLHNEDRNSMAFSLEARVPFLDVRVAELALTLPASELISAGETKVALRRAVAGLVPPEIAGRRRKLGFVAPERAWLAAERVDAAELLGGRFADRGWVRPAAVASARASLLAGEPPPYVWRWLAAEIWARGFLDSDRPALGSFAR